MLPAIAAAAIPSAIKMISGGIQALSGRKKLKNLKRPDYEIMPEFQDNVELAEGIRSLGGMPKASYQNALQNISRNQTAGLQQLRGRGGAVAGISAVNQATNDATTGLDARDAEMRLNNFSTGTQLKMNALSALATQRLRKQEWDKFMPFNQKLAEGQALIGSGLQNMMGGLGEAANLAVGDLMLNEGAGLNSIFGSNKMPAAAVTNPQIATVSGISRNRNPFAGVKLTAPSTASPAFRSPMITTPSMQAFSGLNQPAPSIQVPFRNQITIPYRP